jgi:hypothetical protein
MLTSKNFEATSPRHRFFSCCRYSYRPVPEKAYGPVFSSQIGFRDVESRRIRGFARRMRCVIALHSCSSSNALNRGTIISLTDEACDARGAHRDTLQSV